RVQGRLQDARLGAMVRTLALREARRQGLTVNGEMLQATLDAFRRERGLIGTTDIERWLSEQQLSVEDFTELIREEAQIRWAEIMFEPDIMRRLPSYLRITSAYADLVARAERKQQTLSRHGLETPTLVDTGLTEE